MFIEKEKERRMIKKFVNVFTCDDVKFLYIHIEFLEGNHKTV
jgi:hypothetical protein